MYINLLSATLSSLTLFATGDFIPALNFGIEHPKFLVDSALLSGSAVASQWCIYSQVKEFGALVFAATMNVRQVVSILVSYMKYHNPVTGLQILGLMAIFAALFFKSFASMLESKDPEKKPILKNGEKAAQEDVEKKVWGVHVLEALWLDVHLQREKRWSIAWPWAAAFDWLLFRDVDATKHQLA